MKLYIKFNLSIQIIKIQVIKTKKVLKIISLFYYYLNIVLLKNILCSTILKKNQSFNYSNS